MQSGAAERRPAYSPFWVADVQAQGLAFPSRGRRRHFTQTVSPPPVELSTWLTASVAASSRGGDTARPRRWPTAVTTNFFMLLPFD